MPCSRPTHHNMTRVGSPTSRTRQVRDFQCFQSSIWASQYGESSLSFQRQGMFLCDAHSQPLCRLDCLEVACIGLTSWICCFEYNHYSIVVVLSPLSVRLKRLVNTHLAMCQMLLPLSICNVPKTTDAKQSIYRINMTLLQSSNRKYHRAPRHPGI